MSLYDDLKAHFPYTSLIIECYDELVSLSMFNEDSINKYFLLLEKLYELRDKEFECYNKFILSDLVNYLTKITNDSDCFLGLVEIRIRCRLDSIYERMKNNTINACLLFPQLNVNIELGIIDLINSKIVIDTYKLINKKLNSLFCYDDKSNFYADELTKLNIKNAFYKLGMYETSELLALDALFDVDSICTIDLKQVDEKMFEKYGRRLDFQKNIGLRIYSDVINLLDRLQEDTLDSDSVVSIYSNLFYVSQLDILLDYLSKEQLLRISTYYSNLNISNIMISDNVKRLIKKQMKKNSNID